MHDDYLLEVFSQLNLSLSEFESLIADLAKHAAIECKKYKWRGQYFKYVTENTILFDDGITPLDIVFDVLHSIVDGDRRWDKEKHPNFKDHCKWNIYSHVNNLSELDINRERVISGDALTTEDTSENGYTSIQTIFDKIKVDPKEQDKNEESRIAQEELFRKVYKALKGEPLLEKVMEYCCLGLKPSEITLKLALDISDTRNLMKKLKRKLSGLDSQPPEGRQL